ncbi:MAG: ISAzo13 family transposase, partial [Nostochopsis sp.]
MKTIAQLRRQYRQLASVLDERGRRVWAATEATAIGKGGISLVSRATGISRPTIYAGRADISSKKKLAPGRIRRPGAGRKAATQVMPNLVGRIESLVDPTAKGDPMSPLRWTCKSTRKLSDELAQGGLHVSHTTVAQTLHGLGYSLQANRKAEEGNQHPDRNAQFEHINRIVSAEIAGDNPVISVDTKKKELVGNYKNSGRNWLKQGTAPRVNGHDFPGPEVPRAFPYGIYDLGRNEGMVVVGTDHDTAAFAVNSIQSWWKRIGTKCYPHATKITITADAGGSNGARLRLWKWELQLMADATGLPISVMHFPPGTSKWNKVEHRLFSFISQSWKGVPLQTYETIVNLIASTTTRTGLKVMCKLDRRDYKVGRKVSDKQMKSVNLVL